MTEYDGMQDWKGMDGATAYQLINRHADGWEDIGGMMQAWLPANTPPAPELPKGLAEKLSNVWIAKQAAETQRDELLVQLKNLLSWIENRDPSFTDDPDWSIQHAAAQAVIEKCEANTPPALAPDTKQDGSMQTLLMMR